MATPLDPWPARNRKSFRAGLRSWELGNRTLVFGILNCTPDSFSDGGLYLGEAEIAHRLDRIAGEGADVVEIGGESTRPGAEPVGVEEEWRRIAPALRRARVAGVSAAVSVDTRKEEIARRALEEGASIINDVSGLRESPGIARRAAAAGAGLVVMHMKGEPRTMQDDPRYDDLLGEVRAALAESVAAAAAAGIPGERILVDPGIGFGKTVEQNLALLRGAAAFSGLGAGVLVGPSRKRFLGEILDLPVGERLEGTLASVVGAVLAGADAVRVHDVRAAVRAVRVADALRVAAETEMR